MLGLVLGLGLGLVLGLGLGSMENILVSKNLQNCM